jgi:hypothetical protein
VVILRPWHRSWGATPAEVQATLPGDDLIAASGQVTHAITVQASPEKIWPWLIEIGQDRSGFYGYTRLENMVGRGYAKGRAPGAGGTPRRAGETVWFGTPKRFQGQACMVAAMVEPQRAFIMVSPPDWQKLEAGARGEIGSWGFVLVPLDATHTRLIRRLRGGRPPSLWSRVVGVSLWEPVDFVMERKMLLTIKRLSETTS